jgi:hypothetical protein
VGFAPAACAFRHASAGACWAELGKVLSTVFCFYFFQIWKKIKDKNVLFNKKLDFFSNFKMLEFYSNTKKI